MITVVTELRFTIVPRHVGDNDGRFYFSVFITPTVTAAGADPLPVIKVKDVAHLWAWPTTLGLPFGSFPGIVPPPVPPGNPPPKPFEIRLGQLGHLDSVPFEIDRSWRSNLQHADGFDQKRAVKLWQEIMERAWIAPEEAGAPSATTNRTNIAAADASIVPAGKSAVATVNAALQQGHSTLEGMTSAALTPIAASLYTSRLLDLTFPDQSQRSALEEYSFLLSRQERLGSAGKAAIVQRQNTQAQGAIANSGDLEKGREFHQILSGYGDHPNLLRALGLVFDFSVAAPTTAQLGPVDGQARQFFAIAGQLIGSPAPDTTNPAVASIVRQKHEPDTLPHDGSTVCLFRKKALDHTTQKILTIAPSPDSDLDDDGLFFRKERFDTLQWDLIALLRAAIREKDYVAPQPASSPAAGSSSTAKPTVAPGLAAAGTPIPSRPPAIDLVSHGITIIRAPGGKTVAEAVSAALQQQRPAGLPSFQKSWTADELTRGYLVEVTRCREDRNTGRSSWSQWKPLTSRHVKYLLQPDANAALEALNNHQPPGTLQAPEFLFEADDIAPIGLGVTEGLQPLSGWVLGPVKPDGNNDLSIPLGLSEKNAFGLGDILDPIPARCFLLATHTGIIVFADVPNVDEFAQWRQKPPGTPMPLGPLETILRQSSSSQKQFLYGAYVDLEGIIAQDVSPGGLFLAKRVRLLSADQGAGSAGTIVGAPVIRGLDQDATPDKPAFAEAVLRIQRQTEVTLPPNPGQPPVWTHISAVNNATLIHLRRLFTRRTVGGASDADPNNPLPGYQDWLTKLPPALLNAGAPIPGALFIQGQGELALAVNSRDRVHVVNFVQAAATPGGGEQGELRLQYRGPGDNGRSLFNLADTPSGTLGTQFLPVSLALNGVPIQTLTNAQAAPAELTPSATFIALLQRGADGTITVASLVEVAPAQSAIVTGFSSSNHLTLQLPETPDGLPVEVHPELTMVVCAEPALPNAPAPASSGSDGITIVPGNDAGSSAGSGGQFVRGPWAQQGLRVQVGDTCNVELGPAPVGSGVRFRVNRLTIAAHSRAHTLVGYFMADDDPNSPLTADDRQGETVFGFRELLSGPPLPTPSPANPAPPAARQWRVAVDDQTRIVSGPGLAGQSWRFRQGPPPSGVLVKVFANADLTVNSPNSAINAAGLEILNGIDGKITGFTGNDSNTLQLGISGFQEPLLVPLDSALTAGWQGAQDLRPLLSGRSANVRFRQDNLAGDLTVDLEGTVNAGASTFALSGANGTRFTGAIQALPNGRVPGPDEAVEMNVTWSVNGPSPRVAPIRPVRSIARLQFSQFDAASRRLEAVVVLRDGTGTALRPGTRTALYLESGDAADPLAYLQPQIAGLIASGLPLDIEVDETLVVDIPPVSTNPQPTASSQPSIGNRPLHQMSLFAWPATQENVTAYEAGPPPRFAPTQLRGDQSVVTLWAEREKKFFYPGSGDDSDAPVRLVAAQNPDGTYLPLIPIVPFTGAAASLHTIPAIAGLPPEVTAFLPDQTIFDDAVLHWFGRSAAVGLPGKPGLSKSARKPAAPPSNVTPPSGHGPTPPPADQPTRIDPLNLAVTIPDRDCMPLRFGWLYAFRFRPIYLTGDAPCATSTGHASCDIELDNSQAVIFRPFATVSPLVPDNPGDVLDPLPNAPARSNLDLLPFLRLEPLPPPRLGFPSKYQDPATQEKQRWGDPNDVRLLTSGPTGKSCSGVFVPPVQPVLEIHAPEAPFRLAELLGLLDAVYLQYRHSDKKGNKFVDPKAVAGLYKLLKDLDAHSPTEPNGDPAAPAAPIGFVPYRLPDSDAEGPVLEIRPFGEAVAANVPASASLLLPAFGSDPCTWIANGYSTRVVNFHLTDKMRPNIPSAQTWTVSGITVQVVNGELWVTLPPGMDCEVTFRNRPAAGSLSHLAVTRFLEELAAQLEIPPLTPPSQAFLTDPRLMSDRTTTLKAIKKNWMAATSGFHPFLSAGLTLRVRHMTARPQRPPSKVSLLMGERLPGATSALFDGQYQLDRATTGAIVIQTALEMIYEDDPKSALPRVPDCELKQILPREFPSHPSVTAGRDFYGFASDGLRAILAGEFTLSKITPVNPPPIPQTGGEIEPIRYRHELGDTKHHTVYYRPLAVSRFVDFFKKTETNFNPCEGGYDRPLGDAPPADKDARVPWDRVEIPATVRPHVPVIKDQSIVYDWVPALDAPTSPWTRTWEGWTFTRTRLAGVRLWLERPWYSSGSGEALAVLCWARSRVHQGEMERYLRTVSRWGTDPVFETTTGAATDMGIIVRSDFTHAIPSPAELSVPSSATSQPDTAVAIKNGANGSPAETPASANGANNSGALPFQADPKLGLAVHRPKFHPDERLWYCDIFIRPRRYTPFAFLSVARYQPYALPECALSESVRVDTMQIHPPRTLRINVVASRESGRVLDITLTGLFPADLAEDRRLVLCQIEHYTGCPRSESSTPQSPVAAVNPTASPAPIIPPPNPKATTEYPDLGWVTVLLADETSAPVDTVTVRKPAGATAADHAVDRVRRQLPGLPLEAKRRGRETVYHLATPVPSEPTIPTDAVLRVVISEYELYPSAYPLTEGQTWAPRLVYADHANLPLQDF